MISRKLRKTTKKKLVKNTKISLKKKMKKSDKIVVNATKISQKMKKKSFLSIEKKEKNIYIFKYRKARYYNYKKVF